VRKEQGGGKGKETSQPNKTVEAACRPTRTTRGRGRKETAWGMVKVKGGTGKKRAKQTPNIGKQSSTTAGTIISRNKHVKNKGRRKIGS